MSESLIQVQRDGAIATVVLNRPEKLNALTRPMWRRLGEAFTELSNDDSVRCIVIRGAGTKAFAPGNDIVIRPLPTAASASFADLRADVEKCLARRAA